MRDRKGDILVQMEHGDFGKVHRHMDQRVHHLKLRGAGGEQQTGLPLLRNRRVQLLRDQPGRLVSHLFGCPVHVNNHDLFLLLMSCAHTARSANARMPST